MADDGTRCRPDPSLPGPAASRRAVLLARGTGDPFFESQVVGGHHVRVYTVSLLPGAAAQHVRPLDTVDATLAHMRGVLALAVAGSVFGAVLLAGLGHTLRRRGRRLAALDAARARRHRLVAEASHDIRTPLATLRANAELLSVDLDAAARDPGLVRDLLGEVASVQAMLGGLVAAARDLDEVAPREDVRIDRIVARVVRTARLRHALQAGALVSHTEPGVVVGRGTDIERAIANLVDNAIRHGGSAGPVTVRQRGGRVEVSDCGPGPLPHEADRIFEAGYRGEHARGRVEGSGIGLAAVRSVAIDHGGTAVYDPSLGSTFVLDLPVVT